MPKNKQRIKNQVWLNLAWNYFQQHAQQRISYFNFFVIFSTILLSGLIASFSRTVDNREFIVVGIGSIQVFVAYIFLKIDERNRFLTQHSEEIIKSFESKYSTLPDSLKLFNESDRKTQAIKNYRPGLFGFMSHGQAYKFIYIGFIIIGLFIIFISLINICDLGLLLSKGLSI